MRFRDIYRRCGGTDRWSTGGCAVDEGELTHFFKAASGMNPDLFPVLTCYGRIPGWAVAVLTGRNKSEAGKKERGIFLSGDGFPVKKTGGVFSTVTSPSRQSFPQTAVRSPGPRPGPARVPRVQRTQSRILSSPARSFQSCRGLLRYLPSSPAG